MYLRKDNISLNVYSFYESIIHGLGCYSDNFNEFSNYSLINIAEVFSTGIESFVIGSIIKDLRIINPFLRFYCVNSFNQDQLLCMKNELSSLPYQLINFIPRSSSYLLGYEYINLMIINSSNRSTIKNTIIFCHNSIRKNGLIMCYKYFKENELDVKTVRRVIGLKNYGISLFERVI